MMLLNIPPTREGLLHENDVQRLKELGDYLRKREAHNLVDEAKITADVRTMNLSWEKPVEISMVVLKEDIRFSQRVENFRIVDGDTGNVLYKACTIGYRKNAVFHPVRTKSLRIEILKSRMEPVMAYVGVY